MMEYRSINPYNSKLLNAYRVLTNDELDRKLNLSSKAFSRWSKEQLSVRLKLVKSVGSLLSDERNKHAEIISLEMGKPITQSLSEIDKCVSLCYYYADVAQDALSSKIFFSTSTKKSIVKYQPIGIVFGVMPWNFPYWQVFRFLIPNLTLGNTTLLKHASNVPQCADEMESLFLRAGFSEGVFQNLFINYKQAEKVIEFKDVWGATLTGSEKAGSHIASLAGKNIKKSVLELGGSDPFIVLKDANIEKAVSFGLTARMQNTGQSCIAAKRFIVQESVYDDFVECFKEKAQKLVLGDPLDESTEIGPIAREYLLYELEGQVKSTIERGATLICGGSRFDKNKNFYKPTIISNIGKNCPAYYEEIFGPVALMFKFNESKDAIELANDSQFGLGATVWSENIDEAEQIALNLNAGTVAINGMVKSAPELPFGGVKKSGYGRELSEIGLFEFANMKTINLY